MGGVLRRALFLLVAWCALRPYCLVEPVLACLTIVAPGLEWLIQAHSQMNLPFTGATGFDMASWNWKAGRGLLATLNRGAVKLIGKFNTQGRVALAA